MSLSREWQFDGLVGPTHNYAGLAKGNLAALSNKGLVSNPRAAATQGLQKMRFVHNLGMRQAVLPPHYRPALFLLQNMGFQGGVAYIIDQAYRQAPELLATAFSSSFMWAANAATVCPSEDSGDGRLHLVPANLNSHLHRSIEAKFTTVLLKNIFHNDAFFSVHNPITGCQITGDEGAANHMRIFNNKNSVSHHIFVYGKSSENTFSGTRYKPRQTLISSEAVSRQFLLQGEQCLFFQQAPEAIDAGVFHNDVIAMNTGTLMVAHAQSFIPEHQEQLRRFFAKHEELRLYEITHDMLPIAEAVRTYLFNSQLLEVVPSQYVLVAPAECENHAGVTRIVEALSTDGVLSAVHYLDVRESMRNGGGPACLRLRVTMRDEEAQAIHPGVIFDEALYLRLLDCVNRYYRDRLSFEDFKDPQFINELDVCYHALAEIFGMPDLYQGFDARDVAGA